jgi:hypothetical protein
MIDMTSMSATRVMASDDQGSTVNVSYTVKELFEDIKRELENLSNKLDSKADRVELLELSREVADIRTQFVTLQNMITEVETVSTVHAQTSRAQKEWQQWAIPTLLTVALLAVGIVQLMKGSA